MLFIFWVLYLIVFTVYVIFSSYLLIKESIEYKKKLKTYEDYLNKSTKDNDTGEE